MSIKLIHRISEDTETMEVHLHGPGGASICFLNSKGELLMTHRLRLSGVGKIGGRVVLPLSLTTNEIKCPVVPVLAYQTHPKQTITFMHRDHTEFTSERSRAFGLDPKKLQVAMKASEEIESAVWKRSSTILPK